MIWPLVSAGLALTAVALGIGLARERGARLELAMQLRAPAPAVAPERGGERGPAESPPTQAPPASYLAARRALTEGLDSWSAADPLVGGGRPESSPRPAVLTSHSPVTLVEP